MPNAAPFRPAVPNFGAAAAAAAASQFSNRYHAAAVTPNASFLPSHLFGNPVSLLLCCVVGLLAVASNSLFSNRLHRFCLFHDDW